MAKETSRSQANETSPGAPTEPKPRARSRSAAVGAPLPDPSDTFAAPPQPASRTPTDEEIRLRAYHRYLERGGGHGLDFEDWVEAEKELRNKAN